MLRRGPLSLVVSLNGTPWAQAIVHAQSGLNLTGTFAFDSTRRLRAATKRARFVEVFRLNKSGEPTVDERGDEVATRLELVRVVWWRP